MTEETFLIKNFSNNLNNYILDPETNHLYRKGKRLGGGGFGEVYEFIDKENGEIRAGKIIPLKKLDNPHSNEAYYNEYRFNNSLNYKYICKCYSTFKDNQNAYFLLEYQPNKTLSDLLNNRYSLTEIEVKHYCYELLLAIEYLHSRNIIHRDLKLSNVLLSDKMEVKLCDFGLAIENRGENNKTICGTPNYIAPEILNNRNSFNYSFETDIWSFGIILYSLFYHKTPFEEPGKGKTKKNIQNIIYSFPTNNEVKETAKNLIRKIFVRDPNERPSIKEIKESSFFNNGKGIPKYLPPSTRNMKVSENDMMHFVREAIINDECLDKEIISESNTNKPYFKYNYNNANYNDNDENNESEFYSDKYYSSENKETEKENNNNNNVEKINEKNFKIYLRNSRKTEKMKELENIIDTNKETNNPKFVSPQKIRNNIELEEEDNIIKNKNFLNANESSNINNNIENNKKVYKELQISKYNQNSKIKESGKLSNFNSFGKYSDDNINESDTKKNNIDSFHPSQDFVDNNKTISKEKNIETLLSDTNNLSKNTSINSNLFLSSKKLHFRNSSNDILFHNIYYKSNSKKKTLNLIKKNINCDDIVVSKFIDISSKWGIGYILSNGDIGAYFNDGTKLILIKCTLNIIYIDSKENMNKIDFRDKYNINNDIIKKIKILSLFKKKFIKNKKNNNDFDLSYDKQTLDVYVIKWKKTHKASFFLLSNKEVQIIFNDNTQLIFDLKNKTVVFVDRFKQKFKEDMRLNDFSSFDMTIRVLYAKKILIKW